MPRRCFPFLFFSLRQEDFFLFFFPVSFTVHSEGFDEKIAEETLANLNAKKPMKAAKKGTLKEKKDAMASLLNTVREDTDRDKAKEHREKGKKKQIYRHQYQIKILRARWLREQRG